jgi:hypothetical protein
MNCAPAQQRDKLQDGLGATLRVRLDAMFLDMKNYFKKNLSSA